MKKKILFLVQLPPPVHGSSTMNSYVVNSKIIQSEYECQVMSLQFASSIEDIGKMNVKKIWRSFAYLYRLYRKLRSFKPHLVYFTIAPHGAAFYRDFLLGIMIKAWGGKILFHLHGQGFRSNAENNKLYQYLCKKLFRNSYCIHLSNILSKDVPFTGIKKRYIVPNGILQASIEPIKEAAGDVVNLLYLSNYVRSKGILDLIDAIETVVKSTQRIHLKLVGKPFDLSIEYLNDYISKRGLSPFVEVCGPKYGEAKLKELTKTAIFIFPTYYPNEAFPLVLLEVFEFGIPCISTTHGGIPDIIKNDVTGYLVSPRDKQAIAEKIIFLVNHPEVRERMGQKARKTFLDKYTFSHFEKNIIDVFNDIFEKQLD